MRPMPCASSRPGAAASIISVPDAPGAADDPARRRARRTGSRPRRRGRRSRSRRRPSTSGRHLAPRGDHVVEARADDAGGDAPDGDAQDEVGVAADVAPADGREPRRGEDRDEQRQPVHVDRQRADVEGAVARRRDRGDEGRHDPGLCRVPAAPASDRGGVAGRGRVRGPPGGYSRMRSASSDVQPRSIRVGRRVEVDVGADREHGRGRRLVSGALESLGAPALHLLALGIGKRDFGSAHFGLLLAGHVPGKTPNRHA